MHAPLTAPLADMAGEPCIAGKDLGTVMRSLDQNPTMAEVGAFIQDVMPGGIDTYLPLTRFLEWMPTVMKDFHSEEEIATAFKVFDRDGNGDISSAELRHVMTNIGEKLTESEVDDMIKEADKDGDGDIDYEEFVQLMMSR